MKFVPLLFLLVLAGCGRQPSPNPASDMREQVQQWVPPGTPVAAARQAMEQHQFVCAVGSYNSKVAMPTGSDKAWWDVGHILRQGKTQLVTNVTILTCAQTNGGVTYGVTLSAVNGQTDGRYSVSSMRLLP